MDLHRVTVCRLRLFCDGGGAQKSMHIPTVVSLAWCLRVQPLFTAVCGSSLSFFSGRNILSLQQSVRMHTARLRLPVFQLGYSAYYCFVAVSFEPYASS